MVLADGCFDPIHWGHIRYLQSAAAFGDLVVRVASDEEIRTKGRLVFQSRADRCQTIFSIKGVDGVCEDDTLPLAIHRLKPDYLAKGVDWMDRLPQDVLEACHAHDTRILYINAQEKTSSERLHG